jgi:DNA-binding transcriptional MerR regulator/ABC-type Fe3+-hydroxamate transport system substrate-binding protein
VPERVKTIGEVAELAGVTIETLRHYDRIDLLKPKARSAAGYRLYGRDELLRLREILVWRQLGFPLADISALIDDPAHNRGEALQRQLDLAARQLDKFHSITRGLELAIRALDEVASAEDDVFAGFATSFADIDGLDQAPGTRRHATFAILGSRSLVKRLGHEHPPRVVGTDPIRVVENVLALGIAPVGAGTYRQTPAGSWPWPPSIEGVVRERIRPVGICGIEESLIEQVEPELIFDLGWARDDGVLSLVEVMSEGRCTAAALSAIASTQLIEERPVAAPAFAGHLREIADAVDRNAEADALLTTWEARLAALRPHVVREKISVLGRWPGGGYFIPTENHRSQLFSLLGMSLAESTDGAAWPAGEGIDVDELPIDLLDSPTIFLHTPMPGSQSDHALLRSEIPRNIPATETGRIFELGWELTYSGWFSADWQLRRIAEAFDVVQLRADLNGGAAHLAASPASGRISVSTTEADRLILEGPRIHQAHETAEADPVEFSVESSAAAHLCAFPQRYRLRRGHESVSLIRDEESALARIAARPATSRRASPMSSRARSFASVGIGASDQGNW